MVLRMAAMSDDSEKMLSWNWKYSSRSKSNIFVSRVWPVRWEGRWNYTSKGRLCRQENESGPVGQPVASTKRWYGFPGWSNCSHRGVFLLYFKVSIIAGILYVSALQWASGWISYARTEQGDVRRIYIVRFNAPGTWWLQRENMSFWKILSQ